MKSLIITSMLLLTSISSVFANDDIGSNVIGLTGTVLNDGNTPADNATVLVTAIPITGTGSNCTGTLIATDIVMTAAHCVDHNKPAGANHFFPTSPDPNNWENPSKWYPLHDFTDGVTVSFGNDSAEFIETVSASHYKVAGWADIMLLKLEKAVSSSTAIPKKVLRFIPSRGEDPERFWSDQDFRLAGWGLITGPSGPVSTTKRKTLSTRALGATFRDSAPWAMPCWPTACGCTPTKMCVAVPAGTSTSLGDSGGPLYWTYRGEEYVLGANQTTGEQYTVTFGKGGFISDGRGPAPNVSEWLKAAIGIKTNMKWYDQKPVENNEYGDLFASALTLGNIYQDEFLLPDLAVGSPGENYRDSGENAGIVFLYEFTGEKFVARTVLDQIGADYNEKGDEFGTAVATGDFNNDGMVDLVVGAPGEDYNGSGEKAGMVFYFNGKGSGLDTPTLIPQTPTDRHEIGDRYGEAFAVGDLNNDGFSDLVVGAPGETASDSHITSGGVFLFHGSVSGLGHPILINYDQPSKSDEDLFGSALAIGDFDNDQYRDLVIGIPGADDSKGAVQILRGHPGGFYPAMTLNQVSAGHSDPGDLFGKELAVGDFDNDGFQDLAVGAPGTNYLGSGADSGAVIIFRGSESGLGNPRMFGQDPSDGNERGDQFGSALSTGDFNGDGYTDLAIGTPGEDYKGSGDDAGVVFLALGKEDGLINPIPFGQKPAGRNESGDQFGYSIATVDAGFHSDGLIIGTPGEDINRSIGGGTGRNAGIFYYLP